ncbi:MAG: integrase core domain-containing protein [Anaerolineales bacterium]|jgi:putative transposase|nr:integrase core domain-containing protein [Anaerolineales bacterium]
MYTNNPNMPKVRRDAAEMVRKGYGVRTVARRYGVSPGTISKWVQKSRKIGYHPIPTKSSRPHHHPNELKDSVVKRIVEIRLRTRRTSEVVHQHLLNEGIKTSLNSVRRTIDRHGLMKKRSLWKRYHPHVDRPIPHNPGSLVQIDTIHLMTSPKTRIYVMTLIDVYSRNTYARCYDRLNSKVGVDFLNEAEKQSVFDFDMIQTDHGPEFGKWFVERVKKNHRYSRVGKPNDNAHIERFNRTLQEECLDRFPRNTEVINCELKKYLKYYNEERLHMGIELKTPVQLLTECFQAIG